MLTDRENYIKASLTVATRMDEHQLFSPTHGSPKFLWLFASSHEFPGMRFHCSKLGNIRWAAHFSLDFFGNVDWSNKNASMKMDGRKKQINHIENILIIVAFSHLLMYFLCGCKLHDFSETWNEADGHRLGTRNVQQGLLGTTMLPLKQTYIYGMKKFDSTPNQACFRHPTHKTRVNQKKLQESRESDLRSLFCCIFRTVQSHEKEWRQMDDEDRQNDEKDKEDADKIMTVLTTTMKFDGKNDDYEDCDYNK